jgi:hypothetical protein
VAGHIDPIVVSSLPPRAVAGSSTIRAVQMDAETAAVDWPTVPAQGVGTVEGVGSVFLLDEDGRQIASADWAGRPDTAADAALADLGWHRAADWQPDEYGRRAAPVEPVALPIVETLPPPVVLPTQSAGPELLLG